MFKSRQTSECLPSDTDELFVSTNFDKISIVIVTPDKKENVLNFALDPEGDMDDLIKLIETRFLIPRKSLVCKF